MKRSGALLIIVTFLAVCAGASFAAPAPTQYSIDVVVTTPKNTRTGKIYVSGNQARTETTDNKGRTLISINDANAKEFYLIFPKSRTYRVYNLDAVAKQNNFDPVVPSQIKGEEVGTETVAGQVCTKLKYANAGKTGFVWVSKQSGLPVLMMSEDQKFKAEYSNPQPGPQPATLFAPPSDYRRVEGAATPES